MFDSDMTPVGKILLASIAAAIIGKRTRVSVKGTPEEVSAIRAALESSHAFQQELFKKDATVQSIVDKLTAHKLNVAKFEQLFNLKWPVA